MLAKALKEMRVLHAGFVMTWFLFIVCIQVVRPVERPVTPAIIYAVTAVAISDVAIGFVLRKKRVDAFLELLRKQPENTNAIAQWRSGNIRSFVQAETVTLFGLVLKFLGAGWAVAGCFFFVGIALFLLWTPRMDVAGV